MTATQEAERTTWFERLGDHCYAASIPQLVRSVQYEASRTYEQLLSDFEHTIEPGFENEMARRLEMGEPNNFLPAKILMPIVMQRFGLQEADLVAQLGYEVLRDTCNVCPVVGQCWKAMRAGAEAEECRSFCPNAEAFDRRAVG